MDMTNPQLKNRRKNARRRKLQASFAAVSLFAGCSGGTPPSGPALPPPPAASNATAYIGTQAPGFWTFNADTTQNVFNFQSLASGSTQVGGGLTTGNGVLDFGNSQGVSIGRAVAQPAGGALLRPGPEATLPVAMVQQSGCFPVTGKLRYIYAPVLNSTFIHEGQNATETGYGTFDVSTSTDGTSWNIGDVHNYVLTSLTGGSFTAGTENGLDPVSFAATCETTDKLGTITAAANPVFPADSSGQPSLPSFHFNPAGGFVEDRTNGTSWVGFAMPQAAVKPSDVGAGNYRGFVFEGTTLTPVDTRAVAFTTPPTGSATLTGGVFPNEDLTAIPLNEYSITLGAQDSTLNGVFPNARLVVIDVNGYCAAVAANDNSVTVGFDANGNEVCTAAGVAVISQLGGKYVVYFTSKDGTKEPKSNFSYAIQFYLYQQ